MYHFRPSLRITHPLFLRTMSASAALHRLFVRTSVAMVVLSVLLYMVLQTRDISMDVRDRCAERVAEKRLPHITIDTSRKHAAVRSELSLCRSCNDITNRGGVNATNGAIVRATDVRATDMSMCFECISVMSDACFESVEAFHRMATVDRETELNTTARMALAADQREAVEWTECVRDYLSAENATYSISSYLHCQHTESWWCHGLLVAYVRGVMLAAPIKIEHSPLAILLTLVPLLALAVAALFTWREQQAYTNTMRRMRMREAVSAASEMSAPTGEVLHGERTPEAIFRTHEDASFDMPHAQAQ